MITILWLTYVNLEKPGKSLFLRAARRCGHPGDTPNGRRDGNVFVYPNRVRYSCIEGYELLGRPYRVCQADGQWSGSLPVCRRQCWFSFLVGMYRILFFFIIRRIHQDRNRIIRKMFQVSYAADRNKRWYFSHLLQLSNLNCIVLSLFIYKVFRLMKGMV